MVEAIGIQFGIPGIANSCPGPNLTHFCLTVDAADTWTRMTAQSSGAPGLLSPGLKECALCRPKCISRLQRCPNLFEYRDIQLAPKNWREPTHRGRASIR